MMKSVKRERVSKLSIPTPYPVGDVNAFLLWDESLTLVDVGPKTEEAWESLSHQLRLLGVSITDIDQIIITHHHPDHVGLLDRFPDDIPVYGSPILERWLLQEEAFFQKQQQFYTSLFPLFGVDRTYLSSLSKFEKTYEYTCHRPLAGYLHDGEYVEGLNNWKVFDTPGHAHSHIVLYNEKTHELVGGDVLIEKISSNPLLEPPVVGDERPKPQLQYNETLKKLLQFPISIVYPGHGDSFKEAHGLIHQRLNEQHHRAMEVLELMRDEGLTVFQICQKLFPTVYQRQLLLTMSETIGQLDYLSELGLVTVEQVEGAFIYRRA